MSIIRVEHDREKPYTIIDNRTINDDRISWDALGLLTWLLSKPDQWVIRVSALTNVRKAGKDRISRMLSELEEFGYITRKRVRSDNGMWQLESVIREISDQCGKPAVVSGKSADQCGSAGAGEPAPDNPPIVSTELVNTENQINTQTAFNPFSKPKNGSEIPAKRKKEPVQTTWPADLVLTKTMIDYARSASIDPAKEFIAWKNDCAAHGRKYVDWEAAWRTRIDNAPKFNRNGNGYHPPEENRPRPTLKEQLREKGMVQ